MVQAGSRQHGDDGQSRIERSRRAHGRRDERMRSGRVLTVEANALVILGLQQHGHEGHGRKLERGVRRFG